jgi:hypothetical protein
VAHILRLISFSSAFPALNEGIEFSIDDLARMVLVGIAGTSPHLIDLDAASPLDPAAPTLARTTPARTTPTPPRTEASCS